MFFCPGGEEEKRMQPERSRSRIACRVQLHRLLARAIVEDDEEGVLPRELRAPLEGLRGR